MYFLICSTQESAVSTFCALPEFHALDGICAGWKDATCGVGKECSFNFCSLSIYGRCSTDGRCHFSVPGRRAFVFVKSC